MFCCSNAAVIAKCSNPLPSIATDVCSASSCSCSPSIWLTSTCQQRLNYGCITFLFILKNTGTSPLHVWVKRGLQLTTFWRAMCTPNNENGKLMFISKWKLTAWLNLSKQIGQWVNIFFHSRGICTELSSLLPIWRVEYLILTMCSQLFAICHTPHNMPASPTASNYPLNEH